MTLVIDLVRALREPEYRDEISEELETDMTDYVRLEAADHMESLEARLEMAREALEREAEHFDRISAKALHWQKVCSVNEIAVSRWRDIQLWAGKRAKECRRTLAALEDRRTGE